MAAVGWWARGLSASANDGKAQAEAGARSLAALDATAAASQFAGATETLTKAQSMLGPSWLGAVPLAGPQLTAARDLVGIGLEGSSAGAELAAALREAPAASDAASSTPRLITLLTTGGPRVDAALASLTKAAGLAAELDPRGLLPQLAKPVASVKAAFAEAGPLLQRGRALLTLEKYLFSKEHRILVVSQDTAELKPTGGFMGSFGIVSVGPKGIKLERYADVYTLPEPAVRVTPPPGARMSGDSFTFRDANWWIDFPTSAKAMLAFWDTYGQAPVDGIIALDVVAVRDLLEVTGPVRVASFEETFTAGNLLDRLLYLVEVKSGGGSRKKDVLVALAEEVERRLLDSGPSDLGRAALVLARSADAKHVQFYFTDSDAQQAAGEVGWSGSIAAPEGTTDLLAVSNAMTRPGKVNIAMRKSIAYEVVLQADGSAATTLVLDYTNTASIRFVVSSPVFRDYLRVYRPQGTVLGAGSAQPSVALTMTVDTELPTVAGEFSLERGQSIEVTIGTSVPLAWREGAPPSVPRVLAAPRASSDASVSHYRLFIVRQADLEDVPTVVSVSPPPGWRIVAVSAWRTTSGEAVAALMEGQAARFSAPLAGDTVLDVTMERE
jgi:hypothetical protein